MVQALFGALLFMVCVDAFSRLYDKPWALAACSVGMVLSIVLIIGVSNV